MRSCPGMAIAVALLAGVAARASADVWGVKTHDPLSQPPTTLFRISSDGSSLVEIAPVQVDGGAAEIDGLALSPQRSLYGFQLGPSGSRLVTIDPLTGVATPQGPYLAGRDIRGAAFAFGTRLLVVDAADNRLVEIAVGTGEPAGPEIALWLGGAPFDVQTMVDLVEVAPGALVLAQFNEFLALDSATGALVRLHRDDNIGPDGIAIGITGLAWMPAAAVSPRFAAYDVQYDDDVFAYDPAQGYQRSNLHLNIIPAYNAGRGDLASGPAFVAGVAGSGSVRRSAGLAVHPNPLNPRAAITFDLPDSGPVRLVVFDLAGHLVRTLADGILFAGRHEVVWDGRDMAGKAVGASVYLARLEYGDQAESVGLVLVR